MQPMTPTGDTSRPLPLAGRRVAVAGLARTGSALVRFLLARGAEVVVSDRRRREEIGAPAEEARLLGAALHLGGHDEAVLASADLVVVSPGVPLALPVLQAARLRGVPVIAEVELAWQHLQGRVAGITGSNGKSTTTALAGAMLTASGLPARVCGNIGTPLVEMVEGDSAASVYAVELSSFQLEGIVHFRPHVAVVVNLSPDHLDRYANYDAYVAAKARIFMNQRSGDLAILNAADRDSARLRGSVRCRLREFSSTGPVPDGAFVRNDEIVLAGDGGTRPLLPVSEVPLPGAHNIENVLAAALAALHLGATPEGIRAGVATFHALPHRLEPVGRVGGVDWFNDSKATNVDATAKALAAFPNRRIHLILGGRDKGGDFGSLAPLLAPDRVAAVLLIGEAAATIERQLGAAAPCVPCGDLAAAVMRARSLARPGDVVLLAPACASFDQYRNYEERGEHFRSLVAGLAGSAGQDGGSSGPAAPRGGTRS